MYRFLPLSLIVAGTDPLDEMGETVFSADLEPTTDPHVWVSRITGSLSATSPDKPDLFEVLARSVSSDYVEPDNIDSWLDSMEVDPAEWVAGIGESWPGTGQDLNHPGPWTEVLVMVSALRKEGPSGCSSLFNAILEKIPDTKFQLPDVLRFVLVIKSMMRMPAAFHHAIVQRGNDLGVLRKTDAEQLAKEFTPYLPVTEPKYMWERYGTARVWNWINLCINPMREVDSNPCYALSTGPVAYWVLTAPQVERYLTAYETMEVQKTKTFVVETTTVEPESNKRQRTGGCDPNSTSYIRCLILTRLLVSGQQTTTQAIILKVREAIPAITDDEVITAHREIYRPTTACVQFHEIVSSFAPHMREEMKEEVHSQLPLLDSLDERLDVWIKYCVEPTIGRADSNGRLLGGRPCIVNKRKDEVRLSRNSIQDYLTDELRKLI